MTRRYNMNTLQLQRRANVKWAGAQVPVFEEQPDYVLDFTSSLWCDGHISWFSQHPALIFFMDHNKKLLLLPFYSNSSYKTIS